MRIGILTFHWGANHGAILQSYSTMKYLQNIGHEAFIIDYYPVNQEYTIKNILIPARPSVIIEKYKQYTKNKKLDSFRRILNLSRRYRTNMELINQPPKADLYITGSDQVWNSYFLLKGENQVTPVYFLNFGDSQTKKIAMSVSFGTEKYPEEAQNIAKKYVFNLDAISVREESGLRILEDLGIENGKVTSDPACLLSKDQWLELCEDIPHKRDHVVKYILRKQSKNIRTIIDKLTTEQDETVIDINSVGISEWLGSIRDGKYVITNSFHCVLFCLIFHSTFYVVLEDGKKAGMNDRIITLLNYFGLQNQIISDYYKVNLDNKDTIKWDMIDKKMESYSSILKNYLDEYLREV